MLFFHTKTNDLSFDSLPRLAYSVTHNICIAHKTRHKAEKHGHALAMITNMFGDPLLIHTIA